jgi:hypothetical protein
MCSDWWRMAGRDLMLCFSNSKLMKTTGGKINSSRKKSLSSLLCCAVGGNDLSKEQFSVFFRMMGPEKCIKMDENWVHYLYFLISQLKMN